MSSHIHLIAVEIFYSEPDSTKFDSVKLLNFVVIFTFRAFERADDKPESVDRLIFSLMVSMVDEESLATYERINSTLLFKLTWRLF